MSEDHKKPMESIPATVHEAEEAGWRFSIHLDHIMQEYDAAISELSAAQFALDEKKSNELPNVSGKNADEREANLFPLVKAERQRLDKAKTALEILKVWKYGRESQMEWARSALSFMKTDLTGRG